MGQGRGDSARRVPHVPVEAHLPAGRPGHGFREVVIAGGGPASCGRVQHLQRGPVPGEADWGCGAGRWVSCRARVAIAPGPALPNSPLGSAGGDPWGPGPGVGLCLDLLPWPDRP